MRVEQFLNESAVRYGARPAVVVAGREHSYADLARSSDRVATALSRRGIKRGDRVALFMDDNFEAVVCAFAVLKAGAVAMPISAASSGENLLSILSLSGAVAIVTQARLATGAAAAMANVASIRLVILCGGDRSTASNSCLIYEDLVRGIGRGPAVARAGTAGDAALVLHALDGDGAPVPELLTHAEMVASATTADRAGCTPFSILSHYGLCQLLAAIRVGATLVLETPSVFRRVVLAGGVSGAVPALAV
jgi:acyl-CoA synthetase (AMP-forming)/AMP-acid ligase II